MEEGQEPRSADTYGNWEGQENTFSSKTSRKECSLVDALLLSQGDPFLISDLQN